MDLKSMTMEELTDCIVELGEKKFRAKQIYGWLHQKLVRSPEEMSNVPAKCLEKLLKEHPFYGVEEVEHYVSKIDGTQKFLFSLHDGNMVESVLMKYKHGNSVCISSQAGCRMGCRFCASTLLGLSRNLYPSEMLDQIYAIQKATGEMKAAKYYTKTTGRRITFEYSLVKGVNDKKEHAEELISRVKGMNCHINLIPVNPIKERDFEQSTQNNVTAFKHILERQHIQVTVRREMGRDIQAACGQLRKSYKERSGNE